MSVRQLSEKISYRSGKKGRGQATAAANQGLNLSAEAQNEANQNRHLQTAYRKQSDTAANEMLTPTVAGGLSPTVQRQLESERRQIGKTYGDIASVGLRGLNARGMGSAPSGFASSVLNTAGQNEGGAATNAIDQAYQTQLGLGLQGLKYLVGQQALYDPTALMNTAISGAGEAAGAAQARSQMGSGLGDIGKILTTISALGA